MEGTGTQNAELMDLTDAINLVDTMLKDMSVQPLPAKAIALGTVLDAARTLKAMRDGYDSLRGVRP